MEGLAQDVGADRVAVDVELLEDGLVEKAPAVVGGLPVGLLQVVEKCQGSVEHGDPDLKPVIGVGQLPSEPGALLLDAVEALADLPGGKLAVGGEVEQVVLPDVELGELPRELLAQELRRLVTVGDGVVEQVSDLLADVRAELDGSVVTEDGLFDLVHIPVWLGAGVLLAGSTEEVPVGAAVAVGALHHHPHRMLLRVRLDRGGHVELREVGDPDGLAWAGRACEFLIPLTVARRQTVDAEPGRAPPVTVARREAVLPGHGALLHARLVGHPARFDEILTDRVPGLIDGLSDRAMSWWFRRHHDTTRPDSDHHLGLYVRLTGSEDYGMAVKVLAAWAAELQLTGLLAHLSLGTYEPQPGRYGHSAMNAAENVFATDSAAAIAEIVLATCSALPGPALAAASLVDLAAGVAATSETGWRWLSEVLPQERGRLDRALRDTTMLLVGDGEGATALPYTSTPAGAAVATALERRRVALAAYRDQLVREHDPATVLRSLLHDHYIRAIGVDPDGERVVNRLARAAAQRRLALTGGNAS